MPIHSPAVSTFNAQLYHSKGHIKRPAFCQTLIEGRYQLILLCSPAGFGKSALMVECAKQAPSGTHIVWIELLGQNISAPEHLQRIAKSLGRAVPNDDPKQAMRTLLATAVQPLWLMFDDFPRHPSEELNSCLQDWIDHSPSPVTWWISSRQRPNWNLPRKVLQGSVKQIGSRELAFDAQMIQELTRQRQLYLSLLLQQRLLEECFRWPALICLMLHECSADELPQRLQHGTKLLREYLQREIHHDSDHENQLLSLLKQRQPKWFSVSTVQTLPPPPNPISSVLALSKRECTILQLIAEGFSNREIADQLGLSVNTVKAHAWNINSKLGTGRRTQAVAEGLRQGLIGKVSRV